MCQIRNDPLTLGRLGLRETLLRNRLTEVPAEGGRLQPCRMSFNSSGSYFTKCSDAPFSGTVLDLSIGYNSPYDNGNITGWSAAGNQDFNRSYVYDSLNRIQSMSDTASNEACQGMSWTIDAWGNIQAARDRCESVGTVTGV